MVLNDGTGSSLDGEDTSDLADDVLGGGPSSDLSLELDTDDLGALELPRDVGHNVDGIGSSDSTGDHTETSGVGGVRVGSDHHSSGEGVVLEDDLVDDTGSGLPETDTVLGRGGGKEVVDLLVDVLGSGKVLKTLDLGLNQVVAVDGGGDSGLGHTGRHELKDGHLGGGILAGNSLLAEYAQRKQRWVRFCWTQGACDAKKSMKNARQVGA